MFIARLLQVGEVVTVIHLRVHQRAVCQQICQKMSVSSSPALMGDDTLLPPNSVRGMIKLNRDAFRKSVPTPYVQIDTKVLKCALNVLKPYLLKLVKFNAVQDSIERVSCKDVILNPVLVKTWESIKPTELAALQKLDICKAILWKELELCYENWKAEDILKAVLPSDVEGSSSFSSVGHILHLNLREHLNDYRFLIGQVLLDKIPRASVVVNKVNIIDNSFRNFKMEVVAGEGSMVTKVKENGSVYEFDFAEVYWNSRLSAEHERIVGKLQHGDVVFDMFAGVGPFAVPAAKKRCIVSANDLNPHSVKWLTHNVKLNKVIDRVEIYNLDGREFVKDVVKRKLEEIWEQNASGKLVTKLAIHILMNLPALAVQFLDSFKGICADAPFSSETIILPIVHCYTFVRDTDWRDAALKSVNDALCIQLDSNTTEVFYVRRVAPLKEMVRVSFVLPKAVLCCANSSEALSSSVENDEPPTKRLCCGNE